MEIAVDDAKLALADLIATARSGQDVILTQEGRPVAKLVPVTRSGFRMGGLEALRGTEPDFFEPMSEEELQLWEGGPAEKT